MRYFLIEAVAGVRPPKVTEFEAADAALAALREREGTKPPEVEVVLFMAESLEALRATHGRLFFSATELGKRVRAAS
jgi:hypothetical protein